MNLNNLIDLILNSIQIIGIFIAIIIGLVISKVMELKKEKEEVSEEIEDLDNELETLNKQFEELLIKLLKENPDERITWKEYFEHPFFKQYEY